MSRYDVGLLEGIKGLPWDLNPQDQGGVELPEPIALEPECPEVKAEPATSHRKQPPARRQYITKADLERHGYTAGCPACDLRSVGSKEASNIETTRGDLSRCPAFPSPANVRISWDAPPDPLQTFPQSNLQLC